MENPGRFDPSVEPEEEPPLPVGLDFVRPLGKGQMAYVYLAKEQDLGRLVAVKLLRPELAADETATARFEREARSSAALSHPNVVSVHRFGRMDDGTPYLIMKYVEGRTLEDRIQAYGPMREPEGRRLIADLASALAEAHKQGIVHRDVRPGNVLLEEESGRVFLADFGIAAVREATSESGGRLTRTGQILGDPRHASPEQLRGEKVTGQADIYSLAVLAYELLTGEGPFEAKSSRELIAAHLTKDPRPITRIRATISKDLEDLLLRCLAREPGHRPRAADIARSLAAPAVPAGTPRRGSAQAEEGIGIMRRRLPQIMGAAFAGALGLLGLMDQLVQNAILDTTFYPLTLNLVFWGLTATAVVAWFHGEKGHQKVPPLEIWLLSVIGVGFAASAAWLILG